MKDCVLLGESKEFTVLNIQNNIIFSSIKQTLIKMSSCRVKHCTHKTIPDVGIFLLAK